MKHYSFSVRVSKDSFPFGFPRDSLSSSEKEIIKITFRAPVYLRNRVKSLVREEKLFKTDNEFYIQSAWAFLSWIDLTNELRISLERIIPELMSERMKELQEETARLVQTQKALLESMNTNIRPVLEMHERVKDGIIDELKQKRNELRLLVVYFIAQFQPVRYEMLRDHALKHVKVPSWLFDDVLSALIKEEFVQEKETNQFILFPYGLRTG